MKQGFNFGLFVRGKGGNHKIADATINLGSTKGRGSSTRMFNYCKKRESNFYCLNQFITVTPVTPVTLVTPDTPDTPDTPVTPVTPDTTILVYNRHQGSSFVWDTVTFMLNTITLDKNFPEYSYTAITTSIPAITVPSYTNLIHVTIGNTVLTIGNNAFYGCTLLTSVIFTPTSQVTSIGDSAFQYGFSLTSITIPNSVINIGDYAFLECTGLTSVIFTPTSQVTSIGQGAFFESKLSTVIIPNSVTSIGQGAFQESTSMTTITIPDSVVSIGFDAFQDCQSLTTVYISNTTAQRLGNLLGYTWNSPGTVVTPEFYGGPTVNFILPS